MVVYGLLFKYFYIKMIGMQKYDTFTRKIICTELPSMMYDDLIS